MSDLLTESWSDSLNDFNANDIPDIEIDEAFLNSDPDPELDLPAQPQQNTPPVLDDHGKNLWRTLHAQRAQIQAGLLWIQSAVHDFWGFTHDALHEKALLDDLSRQVHALRASARTFAPRTSLAVWCDAHDCWLVLFGDAWSVALKIRNPQLGWALAFVRSLL